MELYPFQKEAVAKTVNFLRETGAVMNCSEMGCGKSAVTIRAIEELAVQPVNVLVICPAIVTLVWHEEIKKWSEKNGNKYFVISYNKAAKEAYYADIGVMDWDFLVLDEHHYLKNLKALRTKAILNHIWPKIKYKICLSGTPMTQSCMDLFSVFSKICPIEFGDYWDFAKQYTNIVRTPFGCGYKFEGIKNHEKLRKIIKSKFFFRYTKEEVLKDLPEKTFQKVPLGPEYKVHRDEDSHEKYLELLKYSVVKNLPPPKPPVHIATALREQGLKKVPAVEQFCKNMLDSEIPVVVFFWHTDVGKELENALRHYRPAKIEGATTEARRRSAIADFQDGRTNVFLGQLQSASTGITLTRSSTVVFAELSFSPADISQGVDRTHRIGQLNPVMVYYFVVANSIDERINEVLINKSTTFKKVLNGAS